ncbi:YcxB family protein [Streptomyces sp. NPDC054833]
MRNAVTLLLLLCFVVWLGTVEPTWDTLLPALFLAVSFGNYALRAFAFSSRWGLRRKARAIWQRSPKLQQAHEEEIGPEALTLRTEGLSCAHAWSQFGKFRETSRQFVLLDRSGKPSVVVPKRGLSDTKLVPVCRALLTEYLAGASAAPSVTAPTDGSPAPAIEPGSQRGRST